MSVQQSEDILTDIDPRNVDPRDVVIDYLESNPEFFEDNLDLLSSMSLPHPSGGAVSLVERQLKLLREKNTQLTTRLHSLIEIARDNEQLSIRMHKLTLGLIDSQSLDGLIKHFEERLRRDFQISHVQLKLLAPKGQSFETDNQQVLIQPGHADLKTLNPFLNAKRPVCGKLSEAQEEAVFHDEAVDIRSAAMIPLLRNGVSGFLALASHDVHRFQRGMGTLFLTQLGDLVAHAVSRFLIDSK